MQNSDFGAATVLFVNVTPTSPKDFRIAAVIGEQVQMSLSVDTGATALLMMKKDFDMCFAFKNRLLQTFIILQYFLKHCITSPQIFAL